MSNKPRKGCQDIWNSFMVTNADFSENDMPFCPTTAKEIPNNLISYTTAKQIYKKEISSGNLQFHNDSFVHFYIDDQKFDSNTTGIWQKPFKALNILKHFKGVITPDYSTYLDFPDALKRWNTYRMRAFGYWLGKNEIAVINNVRWGDEETWSYCFDGIPRNSILSIGTVASGLKELSNRPTFENGIMELISRLSPQTIIIYGSSNYQIFNKIKKLGINIVSFQSDTAIAFERRKYNE